MSAQTPQHHLSSDPYDPADDPDTDPEMYTSHEANHQPSQAEGEDFSEETG